MSLPVEQRRDLARRWCVTPESIWAWSRHDAPEEHKRRILAAQVEPVLGVALPRADLGEWLDDNYGLTREGLAEFYGYHSDSLRRFLQDPTCHQRLCDMVEYYVRFGAEDGGDD